jgi:hypothetical protein
MSRYNSTETIKDKTGSRYYATTIFPVVNTRPDDIYIVTTTIERLDKLAYTFYDDVSLWWIIAAANGIGKGTFIVPSETRLRIPSKNNIQDIVIATNKSR